MVPCSASVTGAPSPPTPPSAPGAGQPSPWLSPEIAPLGLTGEEQEALVALLEALTGEVAADVLTPPVLPP